MDSPTYTASLGVSSFLPAAAPPPGVIPNLVDPISNAWMVRAVMYPLLGISVVLVVLKLYTRKVIIRVTQLDDCKQNARKIHSKYANSKFRLPRDCIGRHTVLANSHFHQRSNLG